jgi:spore coat polysaccharide biosynthesis protein SpsF
MKDTHIFIQARIRSSRLPGKILFNFFNETVIERIIRASKQVLDKKYVHVLTGNKSKSDILFNICKKHRINFFSGNEKNVLKRFCDNIKKHKITNANIIRITSDNYLVQPRIINKELEFYKKNNLQYLHIMPLSHFGAEIVSSDILMNSYKGNPSEKSKEHVTWDIRKSLKIRKYCLNSNFGGINHKKRITLDTVFDLEYLKKIEMKYPNLKKINCINDIKKLITTLYK